MKRYINFSVPKFFAFIMIAFAGISNSAAQNLYDLNTAQQMKIYFGFSNWDYRMDTANSGSEGYILADSININGVSFDSVGVKYKGNSSYNANNAKNPLHIELDYMLNQDYQGYSDIKLGNMFKDPSRIREPLAFDILQQYMHCPKSNFAQVWINNTYIGLYNNTEAVNKDFVNEHFYSNDHAFFKCVGIAGGNPSLQYLGANEASYYDAYEIKSDSGYAELINMTNVLNNNLPLVEDVLDIDRSMWMIAFHNACVNLDSYIGGLGHNYYIYEDGNSRFNPIIWDLNECFGVFSMDASNTNNSLSQKINFSPVFGATLVNRPLMNKVWMNPTFKKMYLAHLRTLIDENFANGNYLTRAQNLMDTIDAWVLGDPNQFYTYTQFQNSLTVDVTGGGPGGGTIPGIQNLMDPRAAYLATTTEFLLVPPGITGISNLPANPVYGSNANITATISNGLSSDTWIGYRYAITDRFVRTLMYDDGAHGDGAAGDNVYGVDLPMNGYELQYYIYAQNSDAGVFSPERAEHNWHTIEASFTALAAGDLVINEFMARNTSWVTDPADSNYDDWVEIHNTTSNVLSLGGLYLTDSYLTQTKWALPADATIPANGYLIIWCDEDSSQGEYHANFKLSGSGEELMLAYSGTPVMDSITYGALDSNVSMQRCPDGTGPFTDAQTPTFNAVNCIVGLENPAANQLLVYPNPAMSLIRVQSDEALGLLELFNLQGQLVGRIESVNLHSASLDVSSLPAGLYILKAGSRPSRRVIIQH